MFSFFGKCVAIKSDKIPSSESLLNSEMSFQVPENWS